MKVTVFYRPGLDVRVLSVPANLSFPRTRDTRWRKAGLVWKNLRNPFVK